MTFNTKGLMSSLSDEWRTPQKLFDKLDSEFHFDSDPCPMKDRPLKKGMIHEWGCRVFVNPPYSQIKQWVKACYEYAKDSGYALVVMLIPSRTDTVYWHDYVMKADEIRFIRGRLKFNEGGGSAPFPSAIIIFGSESSNCLKVLSMEKD